MCLPPKLLTGQTRHYRRYIRRAVSTPSLDVSYGRGGPAGGHKHLGAARGIGAHGRVGGGEHFQETRQDSGKVLSSRKDSGRAVSMRPCRAE